MNLSAEGISINGKWISAADLPGFCQQRIDSSIPEWEKKVYRFLLDWIDTNDFITQTSSGTTGMKKEFKLPKSSMIVSAKTTCSYLELKPGENALLCLPVDYIAGKMMIVRAMVCSLDLLLTDPDGTPDFKGYDVIDFCAMVPLQVFNLMNSEGILKRIKNLIIGGGEIREELENRLKNLPTRIYATYGMAETCSHVALRKVNGLNSTSFFSAIPGVNLEKDKRGCLLINADFLPEPIQTNDLVEFSGSNSFLWLGRYDNLINSGGVKIIPEELEEKISKILGTDCAVVGLPDPKLGEKLVLVLEEQTDAMSPEILLKKLRKSLDKHMIPKEIKRINKLPRNTAFKIDRHALLSKIEG